ERRCAEPSAALAVPPDLGIAEIGVVLERHLERERQAAEAVADILGREAHVHLGVLVVGIAVHLLQFRSCSNESRPHPPPHRRHSTARPTPAGTRTASGNRRRKRKAGPRRRARREKRRSPSPPSPRPRAGLPVCARPSGPATRG